VTLPSLTTRTATQARALRPQGPAQAVSLWLLLALVAAFQMLATTVHATPESFADLAAKVSPAVVDITTTTVVESRTTGGPQFDVPKGSPFEDFFKQFRDQQDNQSRPPERSQALGSGFVISEDGYIVTNNHVIEGADEIQVEFFEGFTLPAKLIGTDKNTDLALLKVESDKPLSFVAFGDSDAARVGDWVLAMGNPLGQGFSISAGIISARGRALQGTYDDYIQTDAAINRGNSGGPLFNMAGQVIGINTAILSPNGGSIGIGFSMSSNVAQKVISQLKEFGETRRGWLGVRIQDVTQDIADSLGLDKVAGALVTDVPDGPAKDGGIKSGDVILTFDGKEVTDTRALVRTVADTEVGKAVRVVVFRDGGTETLKITLGRRETAEAATPTEDSTTPPAPVAPAEAEVLGMTLTPVTKDLIASMGLPEGSTGLLVKSVDPLSQAADKGLQPGDLVTEAGQNKLETLADLTGQIDDAKQAGRKSILLLVRRGGDPRFVALSLDK